MVSISFFHVPSLMFYIWYIFNKYLLKWHPYGNKIKNYLATMRNKLR